MSNEIDLLKLAAFIESGRGETYIHSDELKAALQSGNFTKALMNSPYKWHRHAPPLCAGAFDHPSCTGWGPDAICCWNYNNDGMCDCGHWPV